MKTLSMIAAALAASACIGGITATPTSAADPPAASLGNHADIERIRRLGQELGDAQVAGDLAALDRIFADDWICIGLSGAIVRKETVFANLRSGKDKLESFELGPIDVQVVGNTAAAHGSVTEKRTWDGHDASGRFLYTDLLEKRGDRWVIVRSTGMRVK